MLTDGLDNNSGHIAKTENKWKYRKKTVKEIGDVYPEYLQKRMKNIMKEYSFFNLIKKPNTTNAFQSFVLLFEGEDIKKSKYSEEHLFKLLDKYTGGQNVAKKPDPIKAEHMDTLLDKFAKELIQKNFSFLIAKGYDGKRIRMYLDDKKNYLEGDFVQDGKLYYLKNITLINGLTMSSPTTITGTTSAIDNSVSFNISDLKLNNVAYVPYIEKNKKDVEQWFYDEFDIRRENSEYDKEASLMKNAYVIVILDGSESFKEVFKDAQEGIMKIVKMIQELK